MRLAGTEMISVEISQTELEDLILQHIYRKHADLNSPKWSLEDFHIDWKSGLGHEKADAVFAMFIRSTPIEGTYRDSKCAGNCGACSNSVCR
jgi:hypothetical protein